VVELIVFDHDAWGDDDYLGSVRPPKSFIFWYKLSTCGRKTSKLTSLTMVDPPKREHLEDFKRFCENLDQILVLTLLLCSKSLDSSPWEGYRESRRCSRDTYPES